MNTDAHEGYAPRTPTPDDDARPYLRRPVPTGRVVIDGVAKDKALVTARLGLRVKRVFKRGIRTRLALVEFLQHDRTFNLSRQQRVLGISTTQHLIPSRFQ